MHYLFIVVLFIFSMSINAGEIKSFTSDGCSAFPDGTFEQEQLWLNCCIEHDYIYWQGGSYQERLIADKQLYQCVVKVGEPHIATLMFMGVRVAGTPYFPTSFRWGFGWPYTRWYKLLTADEKKQIKHKK